MQYKVNNNGNETMLYAEARPKPGKQIGWFLGG